MGRTLASVTQQVQLEEGRLQRYRRALPREDQVLFDHLFAFARKRIAATAMAADPLPMQTILLSMLIGTLQLYLRLAERLEGIEGAATDPTPARDDDKGANLPARLDP